MKYFILTVIALLTACDPRPQVIQQRQAKQDNILAYGCYVSDRITVNVALYAICNVRWEANDLPIFIEAPLGLQSDVAFAVGYINSYAGVEIFTSDPNRANYKVEMVEDDFDGGAYLGTTVWNFDRFHMISAKIAMWTGFGSGPSHDRRYIMVHEMLHVLGFAHDITGCSILTKSFDSNCLEIARVDIKALRLLYGQSSSLIIPRPTALSGLSAQTTFIDGKFCGVKD